MRHSDGTVDWRIPLGILLLTLLAYAPAMVAGFVWDDDAYVTQNTLLRSADGLWRIWTTTETPQYYPLVFSTFWIEYHLWGLNPAGYHVVNVLLHALNALLVGLVLRRLRLPGAWWVALLFAVHPVHVESVAWITERKNVLSAAFYLLAAWSYLRFVEGRGRRFYGLSLASHLCALLSKTVTSTLPVVIGLVLFHRNRRLGAGDLLRLLPFFIVSAGMAAVTVLVEGRIVDPVALEFRFSAIERLLIAGRALVFYAWKLLLPYPLMFNYPRWNVDAADATAFWPVAVVLLAGGVGAWLWRRGRRGSVLALAFYAVSLFPALGFFDVYPFRYSFVADHFQYLASLGILILIVQASIRLGRGLGARYAAAGFGRAVGAVVVAVLALMTWQQSRAYRDAETLWRDTLAKNPASWIAHNNLGLIQLDRGEIDAALQSFDAALAGRPESVESRTARGMAYARAGRSDRALADFDEAIRLNPAYPQAYLHRAELLNRLGRHADALRDISGFLESNPDYADGLRILGLAYIGLQRYDDALAPFTRAVQLGAGHRALIDRGAVLVQLGRYEEALADFDGAIELAPDDLDAYHNRGVARMRAGQTAGARADLDRVIAADPGALKSYLARGTLFRQYLGDVRRACVDWETACRLGACAAFEASCPVGETR